MALLPGQTNLGAIRTTIRQRTDKVNSAFVLDAELNGWINSSIQEVYDLLIGAYGEDYYSQLPPYLITTDGVNDKYNLPDGSSTYTLPLPAGGAAPTSTITNATQSGTLVTLTTSAVHLLSSGQLVTIAGVGVSGYNGTFLVVSVPSGTTFTYNTASGLANSSGGTAQVTATPFYKLIGVDHQIVGTPGAPNGIYVRVQRFKMAERNQYAFPIWTNHWYGNIVLKYHLQNTNPAQLWIIPLPPGGRTIRVLYAPRFVPLVNDVDIFDGINGWEEYVVADVMIKVLQKEESDVSVPAAVKRELLERIKDIADTRDIGSPSTVVDVYRADFPGFGFDHGGGSDF